MTRWWTYALLVLAVVCGGIARHEPPPQITGDSEISESTLPSAGVLRKRTGTSKSPARRYANGLFPATIVGTPAELAPPRTWLVERRVRVDRRTEQRGVHRSARAPPA